MIKVVIWVLSWLLPVSVQAQRLLSPPKAVQNSEVVVISDKWLFELDLENMGQHPALADFPTEFHSNWQWGCLLKNGRPISLKKLSEEYRPIVQVIDNIIPNTRLGIMLEAKVGKGRLLVCSMDLQNQQQYPEARQMYSSILNYINSEKFNPIIELKVDEIASIVTAETVK